MGITLSKLGRTAEARTLFERALAVAPDPAEAHTQLALALIKEDKKDEAANEFREKPWNSRHAARLRRPHELRPYPGAPGRTCRSDGAA